MTKKQKILIFLVILPLVLAYLYNRQFEYSGNWLEDYQNHFKFGFVFISIFSTAWLIKLTYDNPSPRSKVWLATEIILLIGLVIYTYLGAAFINFNL